MIDMNAERRRLAVLSEGLDLSEDQGYEMFEDAMAEAYAATPFADLREIATGLGVTSPARSRDRIVDNIVDAWVRLDDEDRAYVEDADGAGTPDEVAATLDDLAATIRTIDAAFDAKTVARLRDVLAQVADTVAQIVAVERRKGRG